MLGYKSSHTVDFLKHLIFSFKTRTFKGKTLPWLTLRGVRLHSVLDTFGSAVNLIVDSVRCQPVLDFRNFSKYHYMYPITWKLRFSKIKKICLTPRRFVNLREVQLRAVLACAESDSSLAVLANFGLSNLRGFEFFVNISTKTIFKQKHFSLFIRGPDGFDS